MDSTTTKTQSVSKRKVHRLTPRPERTIEWLGSVNNQNLGYVLGEAKRLLAENKDEEIHLLINSYGGTSSIGMSFYDAVSWMKMNLVTIGSGDVDSSGVVLLLAGKKRYLTKNTTLLLHLAGGTFGTDKRYTVQEMEAMLKEYHLKDYQYACILSDATRGRYSPNDILDLMRKNTLLTAEEAVNMGFADRVLS